MSATDISDKDNIISVGTNTQRDDVTNTQRSSINTPIGTDRKSNQLLVANGETRSKIHEQLIDAFTNSRLIKPIHINVTNESYWYIMRKKLSARKHGAIIVKYNSSSLMYEGYIVKIKLRDSDLEYVPQKVLIGSFKTKWGAYKACEVACKERDENPFLKLKSNRIGNIDQEKIISTHFKVLIVSEYFNRMGYIERLISVHLELVKALGVSIIPSDLYNRHASNKESNDNSKIKWISGIGRSAPLKMKIASYYHKNICELEIFKFLLPSDKNSTPFILMIDCKTPSQWRPEIYKPLISERLGNNHLGFKSLQIMNAAKPIGQKKRIKKLTTKLQDHLSQPITIISNKSSKEVIPMSDTLGLDASISGVKYKKLGGIYGHFFNDLSSSVKELVVSRYKDNKNLIQVEGSSSYVDPKTTKRDKVDLNDLEPHSYRTFGAKSDKIRNAANLATYDLGTASESEMMEEVNISNFKIERVAIKMQRIRRMNLYKRAVKIIWKRMYSSLIIQKVIRGYFGRQYALLFKKLRPVAATRIQVYYRDYRYKIIKKIWVKITFRLTRVCLPKIKRFVRNCFLSWISKRDTVAIQIQKVYRAWKARTIVYNKLGNKVLINDLFIEVAIKVQKIIRGYLGRLRFSRLMDQWIWKRIVIPAATRLQRMYRGRYGRKIATQKRLELNSCLKIQKCIRRHVHRLWDNQLFVAQSEKYAATTIQRRVRGIIHREIVKLKKYFLWYKDVYIPSIIKLQSVSRGYRARKKVKSLRKRMIAANMIQKLYRTHVATREARLFVYNLKEAKKFAYVRKIQKNIRRYLAYQEYRRQVLIYNGKAIKAARLIMRAWLNYRITKRYVVLLEEYREKELQKKITRVINHRTTIFDDIVIIREDISIAKKVIERYKLRLRQLEEFMKQASVRILKVKEEMVKLTADDFEKGWAEAAVQEYEYLNHQYLMSREELRNIKSCIMARDKELLELYFELEESEVEIEQIECIELEAIEAIRRSQVGSIIRTVTEKMDREVRREKAHWKIDSVRSNVIKRNRPRYQQLLRQEIDNRKIDYATTIDFERKQQARDKEELRTKDALENDARKTDLETKPKTYDEYSIPVMETYDTVVSNTLSLLRDFTMDERASRLRSKAIAVTNQKKKARRGQFFSLKEYK